MQTRFHQANKHIVHLSTYCIRSHLHNVYFFPFPLDCCLGSHMFFRSIVRPSIVYHAESISSLGFYLCCWIFCVPLALLTYIHFSASYCCDFHLTVYFFHYFPSFRVLYLLPPAPKHHRVCQCAIYFSEYPEKRFCVYVFCAVVQRHSVFYQYCDSKILIMEFAFQQ